jgi:transposase
MSTFKRELVERSLQPGASVSGIALENGINANVLFRWRREHLRAHPSVQHLSTEQAVLLPVQLAATVTPTTPEARPPRSSAGVIEIEVGAARVRLRGSVDEVNLRCVLHALRASA